MSTTQSVPLAERMRPTCLSQVVGQDHLLGAQAPLFLLIQSGTLPSLLLHGPAGVGKTSLASLMAKAVNRPFHALSAIDLTVKTLRGLLPTKADLDFDTPVVFIDEIHRFNKAQQDTLLGAVETGRITLIGATTENPAFSVNTALLSRCQVCALKPLDDAALTHILKRALATDPALTAMNVVVEDFWPLISLAAGDARRALNLLEMAAKSAPQTCALGTKKRLIDAKHIQQVAGKPYQLYDKKGDQHYDVVSAMIKSVRGSDPDAALYWMARMLVAGEPPEFVARRLVILASEDIGLANPNALLLADAALRSVQTIGMPEARIVLGQVVVYLATSPKSNSSYQAINAAMKLAETDTSLVPLHLRQGPSDYLYDNHPKQSYVYPHDYPNHYCPQSYLPNSLTGTRFYQAADNAKEQQTQAYMDWLKSQSG